MAPEPVIIYGNTSLDIVDEVGIFVKKVGFAAKREKKERKGRNEAVSYVKYTNPTLEIKVSGIIEENSGFVTQHPGTLVATLANFSAPRFGFDPSEGIIINEDPSMTLDQDNDPEIELQYMHYPLLTQAAV